MTINEKLLAKRYAQAFIRVYKKSLEGTIDSLQQFLSFLENNKGNFFYLRLGCVKNKVKSDLIIRVSAQFHLDELLKPLILLLAHQGRLLIFPFIIREIITLFYQYKGIAIVKCITPFPLPKEYEGVIIAFLETLVKKKIILRCIIDDHIIAGIRLLGDTFLWECSVAHRLRTVSSLCSGVL